MKRDLYNELIIWKTSARRKPLILQGARQVGKTFLLKSFGKQEYASSIYLNFEEDIQLKDFFKRNLKPKAILESLSVYFQANIEPGNTLLLFDEIQECPEALNSLKYFQEQANEYHIIAAGSLLGVKLAHTKGFPVGKVNFLHLYPLSFFEFLSAIDKEQLRTLLTNTKDYNPFPNPIHQELLSLLKKYMFIGGMPEAVQEYAQNGDLLAIRDIHKEILTAYLFDFAKHAPKEQVMKITQVWESIPDQLAKENKKFIFSILKKSARGREYESAIQWLTDAGLIHKSYNVSTPKLPLHSFANKHIFKVFLLDVGLLSAMCRIPPSSILDENNLFSEFYGAFTENFVAEELAARGYPLFYWTSEGIAEVDFIVESDLSIFPIEVKSGVSLKKKSLIAYANKYHPKLLLRTSKLNLKRDGDICNLPLYLVSRFAELGG